MSKYFVFNPENGKPKKLYDSLGEAQKDAQAIADKYDKCNIYVLQVVYEIDKSEWVKQKKIYRDLVLDEDTWEKIPF